MTYLKEELSGEINRESSKMEEKNEKAVEIPVRKKSIGRKLLGVCKGVVLVLFAVVVLITGALYILPKIDPEQYNPAEMKQKEYRVVYGGIVTAADFAGWIGTDARASVMEHMSLLADKWNANSKEEPLTREEVSKLVSTEYTVEDAGEVAEYTGRMVKLTGIVSEVDKDGMVRLVPDVNFNTYGLLNYGGLINQPDILLNCKAIADKDQLFPNECVELEGVFIFGPDLFHTPGEDYNETEIIVRKIKEVDFEGAGGKPEEKYLHQRAALPEPLKVEGRNLDIEILGVSVDEETGNTAIQYTLERERVNLIDREVNVYVAKGQQANYSYCMPLSCESSSNEYFLLEPVASVEYAGATAGQYTDKTGGSLAGEIGAGEDEIVMIICGYTVTEEMYGEKTSIEEVKDEEGNIISETYTYENAEPIPVEINPDAEMYVKVVIPREYWNICQR